jgi:hypothetical protein
VGVILTFSSCAPVLANEVANATTPTILLNLIMRTPIVNKKEFFYFEVFADSGIEGICSRG